MQELGISFSASPLILCSFKMLSARRFYKFTVFLFCFRFALPFWLKVITRKYAQLGSWVSHQSGTHIKQSYMPLIVAQERRTFHRQFCLLLYIFFWFNMRLWGSAGGELHTLCVNLSGGTGGWVCVSMEVSSSKYCCDSGHSFCGWLVCLHPHRSHLQESRILRQCWHNRRAGHHFMPFNLNSYPHPIYGSKTNSFQPTFS